MNREIADEALSNPAERSENPSFTGAPVPWNLVLRIGVIVVAGLLVYGPAIGGDWLWDDDILVTNNPTLIHARGLGAIWFSAPTGDYWPLTWTLFWIEWHAWGDETLGYHLCSLALHVCSGLLIWRLFSRLGLRWSWLAGFLFVVHPLAVESVAWIAETKNTLSLPLFLLSLDAWMDYEEGNPACYARSVLYFLAAMLAKSSTVMLPFVILLYCWWKRGRVSRHELKLMIPYAVISVGLGLVTIHFQNQKLDFHSVEATGFLSRCVGASAAFFFYLGKFVLPINLFPIYPRWTLHPPSLLQVASLPLFACLLGLLVKVRDDWTRHVAFGLGFFTLNLLPVLGLVDMKFLALSRVADHLVYLPMIGLIGLVVAGLGELCHRLSSPPRYVMVVVVTFVAGLLAWESHGYASQFVNGETLWTYALQGNPGDMAPHYNRGIALLKSNQADEAIAQFQQALERSPQDPHIHFSLGIALTQVGRVEEALQQYDQGLKLQPDFPRAHYLLANALKAAGRRPEAREQYELALKMDPGDLSAHVNLGGLLKDMGLVPEAIEQCEQALAINPNDAETHYNLGVLLTQAGRLKEAGEQYERALNLKPDNAEAYGNLGNILARTGHPELAFDEYQRAIHLNPGNAGTHYNFGLALLQARRIPEAIDQFQQSIQLRPDYAEAYFSLGVACMEVNQMPEAAQQFEQALKYNPNDPATLNYLGITLAQIGKPAEAIARFQQALKFAPDAHEIKKNLAHAQALQKSIPVKK